MILDTVGSRVRGAMNGSTTASTTVQLLLYEEPSRTNGNLVVGTPLAASRLEKNLVKK